MSEKYVEIASASAGFHRGRSRAALEEALRQHSSAAKSVSTPSSRALYATDGSNYRQVPIGVVLPRDAEDVIAAVSLAREYGAPLLVPR